MNNLTLRAISGTVYVGLISVCVLMGNFPAWILFLILTFLSLWEYNRLLLKHLSIFQQILFMVTGLFFYSILSRWLMGAHIPYHILD